MEGGPSKINPNHSRSDQMSDLDTRNTQKLLNKLLEKKNKLLPAWITGRLFKKQN